MIYKSILFVLSLSAFIVMSASYYLKSEYQKTVTDKSDFLWHLHDSSIGIRAVLKKDQPLAWYFSLWDLAPKKGQNATIAIIDQSMIDKIIKKKLICSNCKNSQNAESFWSDNKTYGSIQKKLNCGSCFDQFSLKLLRQILLSHGACTSFIIKQIAPNVIIKTYDIFDGQGYTKSKDLYNHLEKIPKNAFDVIHLGLKITDNLLPKLDQNVLDSVFQEMDYIVAAAGNDSACLQLAYPARCKEVSFDVGAYYKNNICYFSQFENDVGPKIVAPGLNIWIPIELYDQEIGHIKLSGTSVAAAIVTGFLALILSEFKSDFSYDQIMKVIYKSTKKLDKTKEWEQKVLLGAIDMRLALFYLHVLKEIKNMVTHEDFDRNYEKYVDIIFIINDMHTYKKAQSFLYNWGEKNRPLKDKLFMIAQLTLKVLNYPLEGLNINNLFDKELIYLLRTIKKKKCTKNQHSKQALHRIKYSLNRKKGKF